MDMFRENAAEIHRLAQLQKVLDVFEDAHGRQAHTLEETKRWMVSPAGRAAVAYDLSPDGKIIP
jgi:hypothetical protein